MDRHGRASQKQRRTVVQPAPGHSEGRPCGHAESKDVAIEGGCANQVFDDAREVVERRKCQCRWRRCRDGGRAARRLQRRVGGRHRPCVLAEPPASPLCAAQHKHDVIAALGCLRRPCHATRRGTGRGERKWSTTETTGDARCRWFVVVMPSVLVDLRDRATCQYQIPLAPSILRCARREPTATYAPNASRCVKLTNSIVGYASSTLVRA